MCMKKVLLLSVSLLSSLSLAAESTDVSRLTKAVLDNDFQAVRRRIKAGYSQEDLTTMLEMAKAKNKFYHERLKRWQLGKKLALAGVPVNIILGAVIGATVGEMRASPDGDWFHGFFEGLAGGIVGTTAGTAVSAAVVAWTQKNVEKWQKQVNESDRIVDLITDKLEDR